MGAAEADRTLFVGNLDPRVTEELVFELFHQAGPVIKVKIPKDRDGKPKQFAFVNFKHEESVPYGMSLLNGIKLFGRPLKIQFRSGSSHASQEVTSPYAQHGFANGSPSSPQLLAVSPTHRYMNNAENMLAGLSAGQRSFSSLDNLKKKAVVSGGRGRFQKGLRFPACKAWRRRWLRTPPPSSPCGGSGAERVSAACGMSGSVVPGDFGGMRGAGGSAWRWWRLRLCGGGPGRSGRRTMAEAAGEMGRRVVWVDLEMTGLDIEKDQIIEMACLVTDSDLNILAEGPNLIINQPDELLDSMSEWCREQHGKSGLTKAVKESTISLRQAEYEFLSFVRQQTPPGLCPLAGNSVHADKKFLDKHMPQFMKHLHYRIIDVSTVKELCRRWYPEDYEIAPKKSASHRALEDIRESIKELQFYRDSIFKRKTEEKKRKLVENGEGKKSVS